MSLITRKHVDKMGLLFCDFIAEKETEGLSKKTIKNYIEDYKRYVKEIGKPLSKDSVEEWIQSFLKMNMNPISINHFLNSIRVFVNWLSKHGYIKPFLIKKMRFQESQPKSLSDDEIIKLLKKPEIKSNFVKYRTWAIINFILGTGARASSLNNVKVCDVDFNFKEIRLTHLKNKKIAIIPMSNSLERVIKYYLNIWDVGNGYLFPDRFGGQLTVNALAQSLRKYCIDRGVKPRSAHSFRHTFAKKFVTNGGNVFTLQKLLTHTDLTMTKRYVSLFSDDLHKNYDYLCPLDSYNNSVPKRKTK